MILDLDRQYRESCCGAGRARRPRWEFGLAGVAMLGGFVIHRALSPGWMRVVDGVRASCGDLCLAAARALAEVEEADAVALRGLMLGTLLVLATVHAAERLLDRGRE